MVDGGGILTINSAEAFVTHYWGKAQPADSEGARWHPLAYHGLDVAATGAVLLEMRPQLLTALAAASGLPAGMACQWVLLALALHDIGKFADCFQCKVPELWRHSTDPKWARVQPAADEGHGRHGFWLWQHGCGTSAAVTSRFTSLFGAGTNRDTPDAHRHFGTWFGAVCGHHGKPVGSHDLTERMCQPALVDAASYITACAALFDPAPVEPLPSSIGPRVATSSWLVAGVAMLSDWIGSNQKPGWFRTSLRTTPSPRTGQSPFAGRAARYTCRGSALRQSLAITG